MKKRKIISIVVSLALAFGSMASLVVTADDATTEQPTKEATILDEGFRFVDIAHHGNDIVAMAKKDDYTAAKMYYSADGGDTWQPSTNQPSKLIGGNVISANKFSQQQLVYWAAKNIFVAHSAGETYSTADGVKWAGANNIHWSSNAMLTVVGDKLLMAAGNKTNVTNNTETKDFNSSLHEIEGSNAATYYAHIIAARPEDATGKIEMISVNKSNIYDVSLTAEGSTYTWADGEKGSGPIGTTDYLYDAVYSPRTDQFFQLTAQTN